MQNEVQIELFDGAPPRRDEDERVILYDIPWEVYVALCEAVGDAPGVRMTYLEGTLEIMSPSPRHEKLKKVIARLAETYFEERGIGATGYGSATFREEKKKRGLEPDECYVFDRELDEDGGDVPDLAIEVNLTSGGVNKLAVYEGLGIREVWMWRRRTDRIHVYHLGASGYEERDRSAFAPHLDLDELLRFARAEYPNQTALVRAYREHLRG
jgi:Uma2 family endonuclease